MINGIKLKDSTLSLNQRRIRLMELGGIPISERDKKNLQPRKRLFTESQQEESDDDLEFNLDEFIDELEEEITLEEILKEMGYYDDDEEEEVDEPIMEINFNSKGYKEGRKLVENKCRDGLIIPL